LKSARGIWAAPGLSSIPKDSFFDLLRINSGAFQGGLGGNYTHIDCGERCERASEFADGSAQGGENVDVVQCSLQNILV
jgi:hypothetical protein